MKATSELATLDPEALYEHDFYAWTRQQARALARLRGAPGNVGLDPAHLAEEIRDLGNEVRHAVESQLVRLIEHLLKLQHSAHAGPRLGWASSVDDARDEIRARLTPSLARTARRALPECWRRGVRRARRALLAYGEAEAAEELPATCPWGLEELLRENWYPSNRHGLPSPEVA